MLIIEIALGIILGFLGLWVIAIAEEAESGCGCFIVILLVIGLLLYWLF